ncbi:peptidylprolyl isomerase [Cohnella xylanilytica]|uniref:Foldase protein PrsA n=1 Tax=Cohnella xylanilytica TaxID=557555 RepID=A0A841TWM3_9BACL|nr:peptidylprolyl isomerase [Cohnella xylanilytica]MBB6692947.1 peptidylprolyl isomerase [Cohnella xylanilytica]
MSELNKDPHNNQPAEEWEDKPEAVEEAEAEGVVESAPARPAAAAAAAQPAKPMKAWPWMAIAVIAIVALVVVLVRESGGASGSEAVGELNGKKITESELYDEMVKTMGETQVGSSLDQLMTMRLISIEAEKTGKTVSDADVTAYIDQIKKENGFETDEMFEQALASSGLTLETFKEQVRPNIELRYIFEKKEAPTEDQLKAYYEKNKESFGTPEEVKASHILLNTKAEAEAVLKQLKEGADFASLAKEKSQDPGSKDSGGDLGFFPKGRMNEQFETAAFALKKGEMSGVVESPNGFHIIKVTDRKEAVVPTYEEVKQEVKNKYLDEKVNEGASAWIADAKKELGYKNYLTKEDATQASETPAPSASASSSPEASSSASPSASPSASSTANP